MKRPYMDIYIYTPDTMEVKIKDNRTAATMELHEFKTSQDLVHWVFAHEDRYDLNRDGVWEMALELAGVVFW